MAQDTATQSQNGSSSPTQNGGILAPAAGAVLSPAAGAIGQPGYVLFDQTWRSNVAGLPVTVELQATLLGAQVDVEVTATMFDRRLTRSSIVTGDVTIQIPLYVGTLTVALSGWTQTPTNLSFDVSVRVAPPFMPPVTIANQRVSVPCPTAMDLAAPSAGAAASASEFLAQLQLLRAAMSGGGLAPVSPPIQPVPPVQQVQPGPGGYVPTKLAEDVINYSSNTSMTPMVSPNLMVNLGTTAVTRSGDAVVTLDPGSAGWCAFKGWVSTDLNDLRFWLHIGADFWHGGGNCRWQVYGTLTPITPT